MALAVLLLLGMANALTLTDVDGRRVRPVTQGPSVFLFTRADCPISNRYAPEMRRIHALFAKRGVAFWLIYVDPAESVAAIRAHRAEYGYPFAALLDPRRELVRLTGARSTPEVAVFTGGRLAYRGRIDDRYLDVGKARSAATTHDLEQVLEAIAAGAPVRFRQTQAIGCFIEDLK